MTKPTPYTDAPDRPLPLAVDSLRDTSAQYNEVKNLLFAAQQTYFKAAIKHIFEKRPEVESFSWTQYTPYFNDGDPCTFSSHHTYPNINGLNEYDDLDEDLEDGQAPVTRKTFQYVATTLGKLEDDFYEREFGDHMEITINRDGTSQVNDCDHD